MHKLNVKLDYINCITFSTRYALNVLYIAYCVAKSIHSCTYRHSETWVINGNWSSNKYFSRFLPYESHTT